MSVVPTAVAVVVGVGIGAMGWTANINPLYRILSPVRHTLMAGDVQWLVCSGLLGINLIGVWLAVKLLNKERPNLPFLIYIPAGRAHSTDV